MTGFLNGLPERRTGSAEEYLQVVTPHYAAADGAPVQQYRVDRGPRRAMPATRVFYTGRLALGPHQVAVRTANRAGTTILRFRWQVVRLPRPRAAPGRTAGPAGTRRTWTPPATRCAGTGRSAG